MTETFLKRLRIAILALVVLDGILLIAYHTLSEGEDFTWRQFESWSSTVVELVLLPTFVFALRVQNHIPSPEGRKSAFRVHRNLRAFLVLSVALFSIISGILKFSRTIWDAPSGVTESPFYTGPPVVLGCIGTDIKWCLISQAATLLSILVGLMVVVEVWVAFKLRRSLARIQQLYEEDASQDLNELDSGRVGGGVAKAEVGVETDPEKKVFLRGIFTKQQREQLAKQEWGTAKYEEESTPKLEDDPQAMRIVSTQEGHPQGPMVVTWR